MRILSQFDNFFLRLSTTYIVYNPDICNSIFAVQLIYRISGSVFLIYLSSSGFNFMHRTLRILPIESLIGNFSFKKKIPSWIVREL